MDEIKGDRQLKPNNVLHIDATLVIRSPNLIGGPICKLTRQFNLTVEQAKQLQADASAHLDEWLMPYVQASFPDEPLEIETVQLVDPNLN